MGDFPGMDGWQAPDGVATDRTTRCSRAAFTFKRFPAAAGTPGLAGWTKRSWENSRTPSYFCGGGACFFISPSYRQAIGANLQIFR